MLFSVEHLPPWFSSCNGCTASVELVGHISSEPLGDVTVGSDTHTSLQSQFTLNNPKQIFCTNPKLCNRNKNSDMQLTRRRHCRTLWPAEDPRAVLHLRQLQHRQTCLVPTVNNHSCLFCKNEIIKERNALNLVGDFRFSFVQGVFISQVHCVLNVLMALLSEGINNVGKR